MARSGYGLTAAWLVLLCFCSVSEASYEFDNSYYNQVLLDQLDDYFVPWQAEAAPGRKRFRNPICCGRYEEANLIREDRIRERCYNETFGDWDPEGYEDGWNAFSCRASQEVRKRIMCVQQCMWKLRGTLDDKYRRSDGRLRDYYRKSETQMWRLNIVDRAVTKCLPDNDPDRSPAGRFECSSAHLTFSYCVWEEFHVNCPDSQWNSNSLYCNSSREYLRSRRSRG